MKELYKDLRFYIPQTITASRIIFTILFFYAYFTDLIIFTFIWFISAIFTDIIDGIIARKLKVISGFGGYFDVVTDFFLIIMALIAFVIKGIYHFWLLILIGFMFFQFILSSRLKGPIYDPVGKKLFLFLTIIIVIILLVPMPIVCFICLISTIIYCAIAFITRYISLYYSSKNPK